MAWPTRCKVVKLVGENKAIFECPVKHRFVAQVVPDAPGGRKAGPSAVKVMAGYWKHGVTMACPKCKASH